MTDAKRETRELREKIREKNRRLGEARERLDNVRRQVAGKDREIEDLRSRLIRNATPPARRDGDTPVFFLVGQAKSGTSWLMRILDAHPEILCKGEGRIFGCDYKREDIKNMQTVIQPSSLYRALLDAEYLDAWIERSVWTRDDDKDRLLDNLTRLATEYFLTERLAKSGKRIVGDKTPFLSDEIVEEIGRICPGARVIHIVRDGRDTAVSSMHHMWNRAAEHGGHMALDPEELVKREAYRADPEAFLSNGGGIFTESRLRGFATNWQTYVGRAMKDGPKLFGDRYAQVHYEDLLEHPDKEVRRLLEFLDTCASEEIVEQCVNAASFKKWSNGRERGFEDSAAFLRKGIAGDWKNVFTDKDRRIYKEAAGDLLVKLGYAANNDW